MIILQQQPVSRHNNMCILFCIIVFTKHHSKKAEVLTAVHAFTRDRELQHTASTQSSGQSEWNTQSKIEQVSL